MGLLIAGGPKAEAAITIGQSFTGSHLFEFEPSDFIPPDTMGAVGPSHFVELLNGRFRVYDKINGATLQQKTLDTFWTDAGVTTGSSFDPRLQYDALSGHWFAVSVENAASADSGFLVAVSNTGDPTGAWKGYRIHADPDSVRWADYPMLGINKDGVYIGANMFSNAAPEEDEPFPALTPGGVPAGGPDPADPLPTLTEIVALNKANLIAGTPTGTVFANLNPNDTGFTPHPVTDLDFGGTPAAVYSNFNPNFLGTGFLKRTLIEGAAEGNVLNVVDGFVLTGPHDEPGQGHQPGAHDDIDLIDSRFKGALIKQEGKIWGVNEVDNGGHAALRWFRLDADTNLLEEEGLIGDPTHDYYEGSIAVNALGRVILGYSRSGDAEFISSYASAGLYDGTTTLFDAPLLLKGGTAAYYLTFGGDRNRWGDYSATMLDPVDPTHFWTIQEWASGEEQWSTQVTELVDAPPGPNPVPEPASLALLATGAPGALWGLLRRRRSA